MIITVPLPGLGEVSVLTSSEDVYEVTCIQPDGTTYYQIPSGTIFLLQCNLVTGAMVAYLSDLGDHVNVSEIIKRLQEANVITYQTKVKTNIFEPFSSK